MDLLVITFNTSVDLFTISIAYFINSSPEVSTELICLFRYLHIGFFFFSQIRVQYVSCFLHLIGNAFNFLFSFLFFIYSLAKFSTHFIILISFLKSSFWLKNFVNYTQVGSLPNNIIENVFIGLCVYYVA